MFWFDKENQYTTYMDIREEKFEIHNKKVNVKLDIVVDFRDMPFDNEEFDLVVFDPPHLKWAGPNSNMKAQYGQLDKVTWKEDIFKGFNECMRVLNCNGTLVFKWSEGQIPEKEVMELLPIKPSFGDQKGKTRWIVFVKGVEKNE